MGSASVLQFFSASVLQLVGAMLLRLSLARVVRLLSSVSLATFSHLRGVPSFVLPRVSPRF
jgi:hypothetical protein